MYLIHNTDITSLKSILKDSCLKSLSLLKKGKAFQVFQQIAVRNKVNLDELVAIHFHNKSFATESIIKYITKLYPNIIIKIRY
jgi:hypothetical protein